MSWRFRPSRLAFVLRSMASDSGERMPTAEYLRSELWPHVGAGLEALQEYLARTPATELSLGDAIHFLATWLKDHTYAKRTGRAEELFALHASAIRASTSRRECYKNICRAVKQCIPGACASVGLVRRDFVIVEERVPISKSEIDPKVKRKASAPQEMKSVTIAQPIEKIEFIVASANPYPGAPRELSRGQGVSWTCLASGRPVFIPDLLDRDDRTTSSVHYFSGGPIPGHWPQAGSFLCLPIWHGSASAVGVLSVDTLQSGAALTNPQIEMAMSFCSMFESLGHPPDS